MSTQTQRRIEEARRDNLLSLCDAVKTLKYDNEQSVRDFYFYCLGMRNKGYYYALDKFKEWFPKQFHDMQAILNKRSLIRRDIDIMKDVSRRVVFGALTFSDSNISVNEKNMRKRAQRYLDKCLSAYEIIEEHGQVNTERYHVHFLGILKDNMTYIEFHAGWEDFSFIEAVRNGKYDLKKVSKYLCDYVLKQVPSIRRNKTMIELIKKYKAYESEIDVREKSVKWLEIQYYLAIPQDLPF